jgi:hypothetical protein
MAGSKIFIKIRNVEKSKERERERERGRNFKEGEGKISFRSSNSINQNLPSPFLLSAWKPISAYPHITSAIS